MIVRIMSRPFDLAYPRFFGGGMRSSAGIAGVSFHPDFHSCWAWNLR
ncbi:hypothetical protein Herbaro_21480 [Herbaspirillum sp. WKF16]|nr:hypothetical protein [Herbaspirillum sp. WKF16]WDZ96017.1 hypothetical protein Herbaro_21480 [Herbaspirillum sp. WKF16]